MKKYFIKLHYGLDIYELEADKETAKYVTCSSGNGISIIRPSKYNTYIGKRLDKEKCYDSIKDALRAAIIHQEKVIDSLRRELDKANELQSKMVEMLERAL
jgi:hypothetical protein